MDAFRAVRPAYPWLAGSSWSYASTSTISPPTPSHKSVTPIRSGATSWTLRAKKSRRSRCTGLRVVADQGGDGEREDRGARDAEHAARDDGEPQARERGDDSGFEVAERRRARDLHELDSGQAAAERVRRQGQQHRAPEHRAHEV